MLVDVRAGSGWSNPSAISMLQFINTVSQQINTIFPFNNHNSNNKIGVQQHNNGEENVGIEQQVQGQQRQQYWHRVIVFPIPNYAVYIWNALQKLLDNNILQNIILVITWDIS